MAYSAGAIIVNTRIDNTQSARGAREFRGQVNSLTQSVKRAGKALLKISGRALLTGLKKAGTLIGDMSKKMLGFGRENKKGGGVFNLKNMLRYGLGIRSLFVLFNRLRGAIKDGFDTMSKYDAHLKETISTLKTALNGLKGSLASAFAPILTAIAPALTTFINLLTRAINTVGMFFAAITGQGYYQAAKGVERIGDAASGSSGSVKELKRQLAGFDELNILSANSGGGSGSGSGSGSGYTYEKLPIAGGIADFIEQIKELFANGEYEQIGRVIADGLNKAIQKAQDFVRWDNIGPTITKWLSAITGAINGLFEGVDWTNLGATLGEGLNTIVNTLRLWFTGINWDQIGKAIGDALNGLIDSVDWGNLGRLISEKAGHLIAILKGAVTTIKWGDAGAKLAKALNGFFSNDKLWKDLGTTIDGLLQGVLDFTSRFIIDFDEIEAANRIRDALKQIDWPTIASKFWETAKLAFRKAGNFLTVLFGGEVNNYGASAEDMLAEKLAIKNGKTGNNFASNFAEALSAGIKTAFNGIANFVKTEIDWTSIGEHIRDFLAGLDWSGVADALWNAIVAAANGLGTAIIAALFGADSAIYKNLVENGNGVGATVTGGVGALLVGSGLKKLLGSGAAGGAAGAAAGGSGLATLGQLAAISALGGSAYSNATKIMQEYAEKGPQEFWDQAGENFSYLIQHPDVWLNLSSQALSDTLPEWFKSIATSPIQWLFGSGDTTQGGTYDTMLPVEWREGAENGLKQTYEIDKQIYETLPNKGDLPKYANGVIKALKDNTGAVNDNTSEIKTNGAGNPLSGLASKIGNGNSSWVLSAEINSAMLFNRFQSEWSAFALETDVNFLPAGAKRYMNNLGGYLSAAFAPGADTTARVGLQKMGWSTLGAFVGTTSPLSALVGLVKSGWSNLGAFVGTTSPLSALVGLVKNGWSSLGAFVGTTSKLSALVGLVKSGWSSLGAFVGTTSPLSALVGLIKNNWSSLGYFVGTNKANGASNPLSVATELMKWGWTTIEDFTGDEVSVWTQLVKWGWNSIDSFVGTNVSVWTALAKNGWSNILKYITGNDAGKVTLKVALEAAKESSELKIGLKAGGGIITPGGRSLAFADGGYISAGGAARWWNSIPKYAHGTLFAAGEAGPEVVGHIGGRTEVLNKSQLAQTMVSAVSAGMIAALSRITFRVPAMAGSVMPYEVSAQIARTGEEIKRAMDANNEELIQTIISVIGAQTTAIVAALNNRQTGVRGLSAQDIINEINRRTQMFSASPLKGV